MNHISVTLINITELLVLLGLSMYFNKWWIILIFILIGFTVDDMEE